MFVKELILLNSAFRLRKDLDTNQFSLVHNGRETYFGNAALCIAQETINALNEKHERYMINQQKSYEEFIS